MTHIFNLKDLSDFSESINLDELYEKKHHDDLMKLEIFNKILNRVHTRIKYISRQKMNDQVCWYVIPEVMIGVPKYNQSDCIAYIFDKLQTNGFVVRYYHPNMLFISWSHWVPGYVRSELKRKEGISIDGYGNIINQHTEKVNPFLETTSNDMKTMDDNKITIHEKPSGHKEFKPIKDYKPSGHLIYNSEMLERIQKQSSKPISKK